MKISNNFIKTAAFITALTSLVSCARKPLKEMPKTNIPQNVAAKIDSLSKESQKILNDTSYKFYGKDTLLLNKNFSIAPENFVKKINKSAASKTGRTVVGTHLVYVPTYTGKSMTSRYQLHYDYADNYIKPKAVINIDKIFTTGNSDIYVPVEYYGIPNPKIKKEIK